MFSPDATQQGISPFQGKHAGCSVITKWWSWSGSEQSVRPLGLDWQLLATTAWAGHLVCPLALPGPGCNTGDPRGQKPPISLSVSSVENEASARLATQQEMCRK